MLSGLCRGRRSAVQRLVPLILTFFAAGCSSTTDSSEEWAENAHLEITGTSPVPLMVVSSTNWLFETDDETGEPYVTLVTADSLEVGLPVELTVPITGTGRIFFRVINPDSTEDANIRVRMLLDQLLVFDDTGTLRDASLDYTYVYR
jgi:hypothetical protein